MKEDNRSGSPFYCECVLLNPINWSVVSAIAAVNVSLHIVKVDVTPASWAGIHQTQTTKLAHIFMYVPAFTAHRLSAFSSSSSDYLKNNIYNWASQQAYFNLCNI